MAWVEEPETDQVFDRARNRHLALVSESFAERFDLGTSDPIELSLPSGPVRLKIVGVFADYGNERGSILVDRIHFSSWFGEELLSNMILLLKDGMDEHYAGPVTVGYDGMRLVLLPE